MSTEAQEFEQLREAIHARGRRVDVTSLLPEESSNRFLYDKVVLSEVMTPPGIMLARTRHGRTETRTVTLMEGGYVLSDRTSGGVDPCGDRDDLMKMRDIAHQAGILATP